MPAGEVSATCAVDDALARLDALIAGSVVLADYVRHRRRYRADALRMHALAGGEPVLEIGSVPCFGTALLALSGIEVIGVDLAPSRAQGLIDLLSLDVRRCDIEREPLPFADAGFRTVLFAETFEHLRIDPLFALSEIHRVLAPGGRLVLTTPQLYSPQNIARFLSGRGVNDGLTEFSKLRRLGHMGHVREYAPAEIRRFLAASGFAIDRMEFEHHDFLPGKRGLLARVTFAVLPRRFRTYMIVTATPGGPGLRLSPLP